MFCIVLKMGLIAFKQTIESVLLLGYWHCLFAGLTIVVWCWMICFGCLAYFCFDLLGFIGGGLVVFVF